MKSLKIIKAFASSSSLSRPLSFESRSSVLISRVLSHLYSTQTQTSTESSNNTSDDEETATFNSKHFEITVEDSPQQPRWNKDYRAKVDERMFGKSRKECIEEQEENEENLRANMLAKALIQASLQKSDDVEDEEWSERMHVKIEDQKSLSVGIIGAPNAGKSALTNFMVGNKVAAVSRKTNTTTHEILGVMTKGNTQICFFDTPGLMLKRGGHPYRTDVKVRVESAWSSLDLYDLLIVIFDVHRHLTMPDVRVTRLINHLGKTVHPTQKRVLCMNKVDLVEVKKELLNVAKEFSELPGYEKYFMISGLKGSGVKDLTQYLMEQAVKRPWDEDPATIDEDSMKNISIEVVREKMLDHIHQEIPYTLDHRLIDWKELRDGSLRIEQHFITRKQNHRRILVGKNGSKIGRIGVEANEELRSIFKRDVHLILQVRVA